MTFEQAKKDFAIFAIFAPVVDKKGKTKLRQVDNVPDDTEGRIGAFDANQDSLLTVAPRLCFIINKKDSQNV